MAAFRAAFARARPGHTLRLSTSRDGAERRSEIVLLGKF
jgi:hypothetical protein